MTQTGLNIALQPSNKAYPPLVRAVLSEIANHDIDAPVTIRDLCGIFPGMNERKVKKVVETLRDNGEPVGPSRGKPNGYWWPRNAEELAIACRPMENQAKRMFYLIGKMRGKARVRELLGQMRVELEAAE